jgi:alpha-ketoglutarate-dependent taurine dioxygenase
MYATYDGLDDAVKQRIDGLHATHDFARGFGRGLSEEDMAEVRRKYPVAVHPVVRTHEETGRKLLYLNRTFATGIVGWDDADGKRLIAELCREAEVVEYQCRFRWEPNSIAFWDNRAVQHYACSDYWPSVRVMERASIIGPKPV